MKSFLTGLTAGLAIGYLTAPRSGKDTRTQLSEAANKQTQGLKDQWSKTTAQVNKLVEDVKSQTGLGKSEPNLFADREAGKLKHDPTLTREQAHNQYNDAVDESADAARSGVDKAADVMEI